MRPSFAIRGVVSSFVRGSVLANGCDGGPSCRSDVRQEAFLEAAQARRRLFRGNLTDDTQLGRGTSRRRGAGRNTKRPALRALWGMAVTLCCYLGECLGRLGCWRPKDKAAILRKELEVTTAPRRLQQEGVTSAKYRYQST